MTRCPDTDALVAVGDALGWNINDGLQHLRSCETCRATLETLQLTRSALHDAEPVDDATLARITAALAAERRSERTRSRNTQRWTNTIEALLAGAAAPALLVSSGIEIGSVAVGLLTCALAAALVTWGRRLRLFAT